MKLGDLVQVCFAENAYDCPANKGDIGLIVYDFSDRDDFNKVIDSVWFRVMFCTATIEDMLEGELSLIQELE